MKLRVRIFSRIIMALLIAMIFPVSSCRDDSQEEPEINGVSTWNSGGGKADIYFPRWIEGDVISAEEGYFIVLTDSMPYVDPVSHTRVFRIRDKGLGEFPMDEDWPITDFSPYVGKHIFFNGIVKRIPEDGEQIIHVDGKETPVTSHLAQIISVPKVKDQSLVPTKIIWDNEVSEEEYNWLRNLAMNTNASSSSDISPYFYIYVHVLRTTEGKGYSKEEVSNTILSKLETYYASNGIHFKLLGSKYHDVIDNYLKEYAAYEEGRNRIYSLADNPNAIDVFVVSNCNNKVGQGSLIGHTKHTPTSSCIIYNKNYNSHWIAHKIGHCLGLLNTHCCTGEDPKGHHIPQKELVDGSNSAYAGDLIIDTPADPGIWVGGKYVDTTLVDEKGKRYKPDPENIMCTSGKGKYITPKQHERIVSVINAAEFFRKMQVRKITERQHLPTSGTISIENIQPEDRVEWIIKEYDGFHEAPSKTIKAETQSYSYSLSSSHYFMANAKVFLESGDTISLETQVTTGVPDS